MPDPVYRARPDKVQTVGDGERVVVYPSDALKDGSRVEVRSGR